jgi:hypothetical protein
MDAVKLKAQALSISRSADAAVDEKQGVVRKRGPVSLHPEDAISSLQLTQEEDDTWHKSICAALNPCGVRRERFNRHGFVSMALPPVQNARLSCQQGVFLFNGAEGLTFESSLKCMIDGDSGDWYKRFQIPQSVLTDIESNLFQMNIHELSLFPDIEGLAGFVRQKVRLHW